MVVGVLEIELHIPESNSLKSKRMVLRSLKDRLRQRLNVAVSEVDHQDLWQRCRLAIATLSGDTRVVHSTLSKAQNLVEREARVTVVDVMLELR